jgi:hypothetical protein
MQRIGGLGAIASPSRRARVSGGFALPPAAAESAAAPVPAAGLGALLAVQAEAAAPEAVAARAARRAARALDELRGLQLDLLRGGADPARLARLAALAEAAEALADPALGAAVAEVTLRVRVELARRRRAQLATARPVDPAAAGAGA